MRVVKIRVDGSSPFVLALESEIQIKDISDEVALILQEAFHGEEPSISIDVCQMDRERFDNLPEFSGY